MDGLLQLVQRGGDWTGPQHCQHTVFLYNGPLLCGFNVPSKGLTSDGALHVWALRGIATVIFNLLTLKYIARMLWEAVHQIWTFMMLRIMGVNDAHRCWFRDRDLWSFNCVNPLYVVFSGSNILTKSEDIIWPFVICVTSWGFVNLTCDLVTWNTVASYLVHWM